MTDITEKDIRNVADLALLSLRDEEVSQYQKDLSSVLGHFETISRVDTDAVDAIGHITGMANVYRVDDAHPCSQEEREALMTNVPSRDGDHISVKNVL